MYMCLWILFRVNYTNMYLLINIRIHQTIIFCLYVREKEYPEKFFFVDLLLRFYVQGKKYSVEQLSVNDGSMKNQLSLPRP